jgi:hypothetical protein
MVAAWGNMPADTSEVIGMVTGLAFKLEITKDAIMAHARLALFGEFLHALTLPRLLDEALPGPGSGASQQPLESPFHEQAPLAVAGRGGVRDLLQPQGSPQIRPFGQDGHDPAKIHLEENLENQNREQLGRCEIVARKPAGIGSQACFAHRQRHASQSPWRPRHSAHGRTSLS